MGMEKPIKALVALALFILGGGWAGFFKEILKSYFYDRILHMLNPIFGVEAGEVLIRFGPTVMLVAIGLLLFSKADSPASMRMIPLIGMIISGVSSVVFGAWYFWPISVYPPFIIAANNHAKQLGAPVTPPVNSSASNSVKDQKLGAGFTWTDAAYVIWLRNPGIMIGFPKDKNEGDNAATSRDYAHDSVTEPCLWDDKKINEALGVRRLKSPPHGSLAFAFINDPKTWGRIGNVQRQCSLDGSFVFSQRFERGRIYGPFRVSASRYETQDSMVFVVLDDGRWFKEIVAVDAPEILHCDDGKDL